MSNLKVVSWNIAGGYPIKSLNSFDYLEEDLDYFIDQIQVLDPDIICLQESHTSLNGDRVIAEEIANKLNIKYVFNSPASPSHINSDYQLGTAILSKLHFEEKNLYWYPDPEMELFFKDGKKAVTHKKNLQVVKINNFYIANTQMLPISIFGYQYDDKKEGSNLAKQIENTIKNVSIPLIFCGDFNFSNPKDIYPILNNLKLEDALPDITTRPNDANKKLTPDHIYYSSEFKLIRSQIIKTNSDHYLCFAEFKVI